MSRRSGSLRRVLPAGGLVLLLILSASLLRVPEGRVLILRGPGGPRLLPSGLHFRLPVLQRGTSYPTDPIHLAGRADLVSPEGATLQIPYAGEVSLDPARLVLFDARVRGTDPVEYLRGEIVAALRESAAGLPAGAEVEAALEAASRPGLSARLDSIGARLERIVLGEPALAGSGGVAPPAWVARVVPAEWKILVVGLDGADWEILEPMIERGEVPVLARLRREGAWAPLRARPPLLSPLLWTTVATGRAPDAHGILDFLVRDPVQRVKVPITREFRRVRALWNLFSAAGRSVDVVAWWATWPAEPIRGRMVTDRVAYSLFGYEATPADRAGATWPEALLEAIDPLVRDPAEVSWNEVRRFVDVDAAGYREAQREAEGDPRRGYRDPVNHLARVLASTRTYADVSRRFLREGQPDLFLLYFQGIDEVCHRFAHYMPPKMNMKVVTEDRFRRFSRAVEEFYRYQDEVLGEVLAQAGPGTVVMVLSDHGFLNGPNRPTDGPADIEGKPAKWHRPYGIWILHGPPVRPGRLDRVALEDVAPTILHLAGFPVAEDMEGRPVLAALSEEFRTARPVVFVPTFEEEPFLPEAGAIRTAVDEEMVERLRSLGYIGPADEEAPPDGRAEAQGPGTTVTFHTNLAAVHLQKRDFDRAGEELDRALAIYPLYVPALQMRIQVRIAQARWDDALEVARKVLDSGREFEPDLFLEIARIHEKRGTPVEGVRFLRGLEPRFSGAAEVPAAIGNLDLALDRPAEAEAEFLRALRIDPAAPEPMMRLYRIHLDRGDLRPLREPMRAALERNPRSVMHRNWMGLLRQAEGDLAGAEREFLFARASDPEFPGTLANLGALYGRIGRLPEAEAVLAEAVADHPDNLEARVNFGAVLGKLGRPREAAENLEEAVRRGHRTPDLYNALGRAWFDAGDLPRAAAALRESLKLDPGQEEIREILRELEEKS